MTITQMLGEEDLVAVQWTAGGTHQHPIAHLAPEFVQPATGKSATVTGFSLVRFSDGKLAEVWNRLRYPSPAGPTQYPIGEQERSLLL